MEEKLNKKIEEVMGSLTDVKKASPTPFFFTRLEARMQREKNIWETISSFVTKPLIVFVCVFFVIMVNVFIISSPRNPINTVDEQSNEIAASDEYNLVSSPFYEFVNTKSQ
ncbi:MAG: hypothetical protein ABI372_03320 [Ginsengibacter sp.]